MSHYRRDRQESRNRPTSESSSAAQRTSHPSKFSFPSPSASKDEYVDYKLLTVTFWEKVDGRGLLTDKQYEEWEAFFNTLGNDPEWRDLTAYDLRSINLEYKKIRHMFYGPETSYRLGLRAQFSSTQGLERNPAKEEVEEKARNAEKILTAFGFRSAYKVGNDREESEVRMAWVYPVENGVERRVADVDMINEELWRQIKNDDELDAKVGATTRAYKGPMLEGKSAHSEEGGKVGKKEDGSVDKDGIRRTKPQTNLEEEGRPGATQLAHDLLWG